MHPITKRIFDIVFSLCVLVLCFPLFVTVALAIKCTSKGPIFYRGLRVGKEGKLFTFWKFRTMRKGAKKELRLLLAQDEMLEEEWNQFQKLKDDPRITNLGKFLRLFSIDELPQFWNVLIGDLSVVGPRPVEIYNRENWREDVQKRFEERAEMILSIKPGITCLWQTKGRNLLSTKRQVELEEEYIHNQSLLLDLKIICKTVYIVIFPKGAY